MPVDDRKLMVWILLAWLSAVVCFIAILLAPTPRGKGIAIGCFLLIFSSGGGCFVRNMIADGQIGVGHGTPIDFIRRDEDAARFWKVVAVVIVVSAILFLIAILFLLGVVGLPAS